MADTKKSKRKINIYTREGRIIKAACNSIPMGICIGTMEGIPRLTNEEMQHLSMTIFGSNLTSSIVFWNDLENFTESPNAEKVSFTDTPSIKLADGRIYNFTKRVIRIKHIMHEEILASDVTDKYELSEKLKSENALLKKQAEELDKLRENIATLNRDEEVLESKMRVHYELGRVILSSRRYLMGEDSVEKKELLEMWDHALGVFENPLFSEKASYDFIAEMKAMAQSNGCTMNFEGVLDFEDDLMMTVVREGLVNAVRHGGATEVNIVCNKARDNKKLSEEHRNMYYVQVVDNGKGLSGDKVNKGGLEDLTARLKENGGNMRLYNRSDASGTILEAVVVCEDA